ncbi:MAG: hypothetical protein J6L76_05870 [Clostridia bacterium]|nr:hypothetical protein [Clostridia bacterium]
MITNICIQNEGYIQCESAFYQTVDILHPNIKIDIHTGINYLYGEIDSGNWGISYLMSMYPYRSSNMQLFMPAEAVVNQVQMTLMELSQYTCYMDRMYPLFSSEKTVRQLIQRSIKETGIVDSAEEIREMFHLDAERFERPLSQVGNEIFRMMAAIGYCEGKQVFCFPWLSKMRYESYHNQLTTTLDILTSLAKIAILPVGK